MNDMFQKVYDQITVPEDLKKETLAKMEKENQRYTQANHIRRNKSGSRERIFATGFVALVVCAAALCLVLQRPVGVVYITDMSGNTYHDDVKLEDGVIHFVSNRVSISVSPNVGNASSDWEQEISETDDLIEEVTTKSGGKITYCRIFSLPTLGLNEDSQSYIGEQPIYVTMSDAEEIKYQADFEIEGQAYELIGVNVTQKEFIDYLYEIIKK